MIDARCGKSGNHRLGLHWLREHYRCPMKAKFVLAVSIVAVLNSGCSNSNYHSSQWDLDSKTGAMTYSVDGWVWLANLSGTNPSKRFTEGEFPSFVGRTGYLCCTRGGALWLYDLATGSGRQLTNPGDHEEDGQAAYNPADGRIYFNRHIEDGWLRPSRYDIYSCRMDSSDLVRHTTLGWHFSRISSRPFSGGSLDFVGDSPEVSRTPDAAVMKLSLKFPYSVTQVFPSFADPWEISASLDGSRLALITSVRDGYECWSIEAKTGSSTMVGKLGYGSEWPLFAPDRSSVLFMMHKDGRVTLDQITAKGQESVLFQVVPEPVANDPKQTRVGQ